MPSNLFRQARKAWFNKSNLVILDNIDVTHDHMKVYGGPRELSKCDLCTAMEWYTRITGINRFTAHACPDPDNYDLMKAHCAKVLRPEWLHIRRNYNFALRSDPALPGLKCLFVAGDPHLLVHHGPKTGLMLWRKRMSPYQTTFCSFEDVAKYKLNNFDFIVMTVHGRTPVLSQKSSPPIFLYCHDHHPPAIRMRAQTLFDNKPAAVLTPYPSIWNNAFNIDKATKVIFTPFLADPFWTYQNTDFKNRKYDVMVIGVTGHVYPERVAMAETIEKAKSLPFKLKMWRVPAPRVQGEQLSADKYGSPPLLLWSKHLAQARICVFGQDKFGYLVNKYSEIPSACSLMVAPKIADCQLVGLEPNRHYIPLERPVGSRLVNQLAKLVRGFGGYKQIALNGLQWFNRSCEHWLYDHFWREVSSVLKETRHATTR
jgi:hypothetical protein